MFQPLTTVGYGGSAASAATPGGSSGQLQVNSAGALGGVSFSAVAASGALLTLSALATSDTPLVVKGYAAQSASLQEWRSSTNTVLASVSAAGAGTFASLALGSSGDAILNRDAADIVSIRRLTAAQTLRVYNTGDSSSGEWWETAWSGNQCLLRTRSAGAGSARDLVLRTAKDLIFQNSLAATTFYIAQTTGHVLFGTDNTYDIGASGATRPRNVYVANTVTAGSIVTGTLSVSSSTSTFNQISIAAANAMIWSGRTRIRSSADGVVELTNNAETDFGRLNLGPATSSFPALARSGAALHVKLADNSAIGELVFKLPTANPGPGTLWNNAGVLTIGT